MEQNWAALGRRQVQRPTKHRQRQEFKISFQVVVRLPGHPPENKCSLSKGQQGRFRSSQRSSFILVPHTQSLSFTAKKHHRKSCSRSLISNCGCVASLRSTEVLVSQIYSLLFTVTQDPQLGWLSQDALWCMHHRGCVTVMAFWRHTTDKKPQPEVKAAQKTSNTIYYHPLIASL